MLLLPFALSAQEARDSFCIEFKVNSRVVDPSFGNNAETLKRLDSFLRSVETDSTVALRSVEFCGAASPDGRVAANKKLALARFESLNRYVRGRADLPGDLSDRRCVRAVSWRELAGELEKTDMAYKDEILNIINASPDAPNVAKIKALHGGKAWQTLNREIFGRMRNASVIFVTFKEIPPEPEPEPEPIVEPEPVPEPEPEPEPIVEPEPVPEPEPEPVAEEPRHWYLKTNAIGWAMFVSNLAVEVDFGKNWSFTLPIYYSGMNYFKRTLKFRTFTVQPEIRYWFSGGDGFFIGAHAGMGYFNYALNGDYRIQDRDADTPAWGGGVSGGYRMPLGKSKRWKMEFTLGAGVYSAKYDKFKNERNGALVSTHKTTFFGIDNAAVTFVYTFDRKNRRK